ncbi:MAG: response regulator [Pseudomonadota bacterium]
MTGPLPPKRILIIEDEILIQKSLKKILEKRGAQVDAVSNGKEAIQMITQHNYDKIICDLMLQDITGFDVLEESKKKYSISEISQLFIIITAYISKQVLDKAANYGCKIISKPFDDLKIVIEEFLK